MVVVRRTESFFNMCCWGGLVRGRIVRDRVEGRVDVR